MLIKYLNLNYLWFCLCNTLLYYSKGTTIVSFSFWVTNVNFLHQHYFISTSCPFLILIFSCFTIALLIDVTNNVIYITIVNCYYITFTLFFQTINTFYCPFFSLNNMKIGKVDMINIVCKKEMICILFSSFHPIRSIVNSSCISLYKGILMPFSMAHHCRNSLKSKANEYSKSYISSSHLLHCLQSFKCKTNTTLFRYPQC